MDEKTARAVHGVPDALKGSGDSAIRAGVKMTSKKGESRKGVWTERAIALCARKKEVAERELSSQPAYGTV